MRRCPGTAKVAERSMINLMDASDLSCKNLDWTELESASKKLYKNIKICRLAFKAFYSR